MGPWPLDTPVEGRPFSELCQHRILTKVNSAIYMIAMSKSHVESEVSGEP